MKVKCVSKYYDKGKKRLVDEDEVIEVNEERAEKLAEAGVCIIIEEKKPEPVNAEKKAEVAPVQPKKTRKKKETEK